MSKTLEKLVEKALTTGHSNINGRQRWYGYTGELQSKYSMRYTEQGNLHVYHWGTKILCLGNLKSSKPIVKGFYGQSKSDRDALQFLFDYFETGYSAKYRPSVDEFSITADFGTGELETQTK